MPTGLSNAAGKPNDDRNHVAERCKGDEEIQSTHSTAIAEDFVEKQSGSRKVGVLQLVFRNWDSVSLDVLACECWQESVPAAKNATLANMYRTYTAVKAAVA